MATVGTNNPTLVDAANAMDPEGGIAPVVELLSEQNELWSEATVIEGNLPTGHKYVQRTGLPTVTWRKSNEGIDPSKSIRTPVTDNAGSLEGYAEVDKRIADLGGDTAAYRASEGRAFIEAMNQGVADAFCYGDTTVTPEKYDGVLPRYDSTSEANGDNILLGGGSGSDNTSVLLVGWSPDTVSFFHPKGSMAGLQRTDKGQVTLEDANSKKYEGYREHWAWELGLAVADWRYIVAIRNIDVSDLTKNASGSSADLVDLMIQALELMPSLAGVRPAFYVNRKIRGFLRRQVRNSTNVNLSIGEVAGKRAVMFDEVPIRRLDALLNTESTIS